jgi:uncharacterized protein with GYD domain
LRPGHNTASPHATQLPRPFEGMGVRFRDIYWTLGSHDIVSIVDAPDGETLAAALLVLASQGNVRTTTLRALSADEMRGVIAKTS